MTMKKKFLGLALTGAMVLPATGAVFANPVKVEVPTNGGNQQVVTMDVGITDDSNQVQGQVIVEMPTQFNVVVDNKGNVGSYELNVKNSSVDHKVNVSLDRFEHTGAGGVDIKADSTSLTKRNELYLTLKGDAGKTVNLGQLLEDPTSQQDKRENMLEVASGSNKNLILSGSAGTGAINNQQGIQDQFKVMFRLGATK